MAPGSRALVLALAAAALIWAPRSRARSDANASDALAEDPRADARYAKRSVHEEAPPQLPCNVSVRRLMPTSLIAHWERPAGFQCDVHVYTTNRGRALFCAAFNWVASPVVVEHLAVSGGQQHFRLCVGCGLARSSRLAHASASAEPASFCCVEFALDELKADSSWTLNRKPIESTLVACFMTLVIIVWSVAALIWPVPIIAGFLPNGMEQRRPR